MRGERVERERREGERREGERRERERAREERERERERERESVGGKGGPGDIFAVFDDAAAPGDGAKVPEEARPARHQLPDYYYYRHGCHGVNLESPARSLLLLLLLFNVTLAIIVVFVYASAQRQTVLARVLKTPPCPRAAEGDSDR